MTLNQFIMYTRYAATVAKKENKKFGDKHVLHNLHFDGGGASDSRIGCDRFLRLYINKGATAWGTSVWEMQVWADPLGANQCYT